MTEQEKRAKVIAEIERVADEANPWKESPPLRCDISYPLLIDALALLKAQETCEDAVNRKDVINVIKSPCDMRYINGNWQPCIGDYIEAINNLPAAAPKAQEPRVMTLEEVKALQPDMDIWIEVRYLNAPIRIRACTVSGFSPGGTRLFIIGGAHNYPMDMYNNYFRCWTSRPTDEQREATPW